MDSQDLAIFAAVAEQGSITAAARRLNTVQSNVTARIKALEEGVGQLLFHRSARGVTLTRAGEMLLPYARRVGSLMQEARAALSGLADPAAPAGPLAIGSMETTAAVRLPEVLARFHRSFPAVELSVVTGSTALLTAEVLAHRLDGALVAGPVDDPDLIAEPVGVEEMVIATAADVAWPDCLMEGERRPAALAFRQGCAYRRLLDGALTSVTARPVRMLEFGTLEGIIGGVAAGIGVALLPRATVDGARLRPALALHPVAPPWNSVDTVFIRRRDGLATGALLRFLEHARQGWTETADPPTRPVQQVTIGLHPAPTP